MTRHVPISEFKDNASKLFAAVEAGDEIIVTRHGKARAKIVPIDDDMDERRRRSRAALDALRVQRDKMRADGRTASMDEMIAWKNDGRP